MILWKQFSSELYDHTRLLIDAVWILMFSFSEKQLQIAKTKVINQLIMYILVMAMVQSNSNPLFATVLFIERTYGWSSSLVMLFKLWSIEFS